MTAPFNRSIQKRLSLLTNETNALRLIDGAGDQIPGIILETYADKWLVSTQTPLIPDDFKLWVCEQGKTVYHKRLDRKEKESPTHLCGAEAPERFISRENGINYEISFSSGYSQGIFLDQRENRAELINRSRPGQKILNTFSYTGAFSVCAARSGATTTTLDLSQPYLDWARRNMQLNEIDPSEHFFCKGDTFHWLARFGRQGKFFDGIVLDPPTFARDHKGKVFRIEKDYGRLVDLALQCLAPDGWLLACTNYRQMSTDEFKKIISSSTRGKGTIRAMDMPAEYTNESYLKSIWLER